MTRPAPYGPKGGSLSEAGLPRLFRGLDFNLQVPDEEEAEESVSEDEADPEVFPDAPNSVPFMEKLRLLPRLVLPPCLLGLCLLIYTTQRLALLRLLVAPPQTLKPFV